MIVFSSSSNFNVSYNLGNKNKINTKNIKGVNFQKVAVVKNFFDEYEYEPEILTETLFQQDLAQGQAVFLEKLRVMMTAFPEIYEQNKKILFEDFAKAYKDDTDRYTLEAPAPIGMPGMPTGMPQGAPAPAGGAKVGGEKQLGALPPSNV